MILIKSAEQLGKTKLMFYVATAWLELHVAGYATNNTVPIHESYPVLWAVEEDGQVVGILVYQNMDQIGDMWINLVWVRKDQRRKGIYKLLYQRLKLIAKEKTAISISGGICPTNLSASKAARSVGREIYYAVWRDDLLKEERTVHEN
jgi:GNAT superfamily N-acetyltransferase